MSGNIDYLLKNVVNDSPPKGAFYKDLIVAMETSNRTTTLPLSEAR